MIILKILLIILIIIGAMVLITWIGSRLNRSKDRYTSTTEDFGQGVLFGIITIIMIGIFKLAYSILYNFFCG